MPLWNSSAQESPKTNPNFAVKKPTPRIKPVWNSYEINSYMRQFDKDFDLAEICGEDSITGNGVMINFELHDRLNEDGTPNYPSDADYNWCLELGRQHDHYDGKARKKEYLESAKKAADYAVLLRKHMPELGMEFEVCYGW